ncbi:ElaB/YqjD/DUF883 family membrane-anchored ribosome-binding protein [Duganella sp. SG902]|uniref:DUF883 family protein n=1 Tax=Duganella sp. SG902 TaxID=2587016 RepID=UPI00159E8BB1|nr:DUF883 family protein [Duganella sp. SG902]NVM76132.1 ElaB/YqjD/DUF883 family membrane-anchored ribosome-binding protein [Duganella sp. SG902]
MEPTSTVAEAQAASGTVRDRLMDDLQHTIGEAEKWLQDSAGEEAGVRSDTRARFDDTLRTARSDLRKLEDSFLAHSRDAADSVNTFVRENPWQAAGIGVALGVVVGMLLSRK